MQVIIKNDLLNKQWHRREKLLACANLFFKEGFDLISFLIK